MTKLILFIFLLTLFSSCDCDECQKNKEPWETVVEMVSHPETFDQYIQDHEDEFDKAFKSCVTRKREKLEKLMGEEEDQCALQFSNDLATYEACTRGIDKEYLWTLKFLVVIEGVVNGYGTFENSITGQEMLYLKSEQPVVYQEIVNLYQTSTTPNKWFVCEECESKVLCLF